MRMSRSLICTVGASLVSNILRDEELKKLYEAKEVEKIGQYLVDKKEDPEKDQMFGAEINSIASIVALNYISERRHLHFLVSDTNDGKKVGAILKYYFERSKLAFEKVEVHVVDRLDDARMEDFKRYGLRNLIKKIAEIIRVENNDVVINATGGYKAQIAFALALGQGLKIPVYYRFERFKYVIELFPLPLTLDDSYYFEYNDLFEIVEDEDNLSEFEGLQSMYNQLPEGARIFFDVDWINNKKYITINPMGQTYLEIVRNSVYNRVKQVTIEKAAAFKFISRNDEGHSLPMIQKYRIDEMLRDFGYITEARVLKYSLANNDKRPYVSIRGDELAITFHTKNGILHLAARTTARDKNELEMIRQKLKDYLADKFN